MKSTYRLKVVLLYDCNLTLTLVEAIEKRKCLASNWYRPSLFWNNWRWCFDCIFNIISWRTPSLLYSPALINLRTKLFTTIGCYGFIIFDSIKYWSYQLKFIEEVHFERLYWSKIWSKLPYTLQIEDFSHDSSKQR